MTTTLSPPPARRAAPSGAEAATVPSLGHIPALDGLRGAAVVGVLLYHGGYLDGGYLGVDLFFVLSGFLITSLLVVERARTGRIDLLHFWLRRARRLLPAVFLLFAGVALYSTLWARSIELGAIRSSGLGALFYVANWQQILHGTNYWDISLAPSPLQHVWSLAIEEQFYLLWPFAVLLMVRGRGNPGRVVQWTCLALAAVSAELFVILHWLGASDTRVYQGTDTRATALLLGAALAGWRAASGPVEDHRRRDVIELAGIVAVVVLALAWILLEGTSVLLYRGGLPLASVLAAVVLWAASNRRSPVLGPMFSVAPLRWLGLISYGLYLWHWPVYLVLDENRTGLSGLALLALRLAVALAISLVSYHLLEQPIRKGVLRKPGAKAGAFLGALAAVVAMIWATAGAVPPAAVNQGAAAVVATSRIDGAPTVMVVGDSVGNSVVGPMIDDPWTYGINPVNKTKIGCQLMFRGHRVRNASGVVREQPDCTAAYPADVARYRPDVVLLFFGGGGGEDIEVDGSFVDACAPSYQQEQERLYAQAIDDLGSAGADVALVTIAPAEKGSFHPPSWNEHINCYDDVLRTIATERDVPLIDLAAWLCPDGNCKKEIGGAPARPDSLHFNGPGGRAVAAYLVEEGLQVAGLEAAASADRVPEYCAELRAATGPLVDLLDRTDADARRSSLDRMGYADFDGAASRAPAEVADDVRVVGASQSEIERVLRGTPDGTKLTLQRFPTELAATVGRLDRFLDDRCTGR